MKNQIKLFYKLLTDGSLFVIRKFVIGSILTLNFGLETLNCSAQVIAGGESHSIVVCNDGTARSWGWDNYGQLGDDAALVDQPTPVAVAGLTGTIAVAGGYYQSLALKNDGTVWAWGDDGFGQLGDDDSIVNHPTPVQVKPNWGGGITAIAGGWIHCMALKNDGTVWSWGYDGSGQLGDGATLADKRTPVQVASLTGIIAIAAGFYHSLALKNDGTVWTWGDDSQGQLGNNTTFDDDQPVPVQVASLTGIIAIAGGYYHSLAVKNDGTVWTWGNDNYGQLGDDTALVNQPTPVQVVSLTGITAVTGGLGHSLALKNDSTIWSWGADQWGQLGNNVTFGDNQPIPVQVASLAGITAIAGGYGHCLALKNDGTVWAWGSDSQGQLGDDILFASKPTPVQVSALCMVIPLYVEPLSSSANYNITVFPNPANNELNITVFSQTDDELNIEAYDVLGQSIINKVAHVVGGNNKFILDLSTVAQGMYILRVNNGTVKRNENLPAAGRFVKE